jgi:hypothetical protein
MAGAAVTGSGQIFLSGSAIADDSTATNSLLNSAQGDDPYDESNISSAYKTDTSLTEINQLFNSDDFTNGGAYDSDAPHSMQECYGNQNTSGGGGR